MNLIAWVRSLIDRRRARRALLATPGVDLLVRRVMDERYGKHNWRVRDDFLEALVHHRGDTHPHWGLIGPLRSHNTRAWLRNGGSPVSHAKLESIPRFVNTHPHERRTH